MKAVRRVGSQVAMVEVPRPGEPTEGRVRVRVVSAGICGSDLHMLAEGLGGVTLGHEFGGLLDDGTVVAVRPTGWCGQCAACSSGRGNLCGDAFMRFHGGTIDGGCAEEVLVDADEVYPVPANVPPSAAALVEPIAVAVHGLRRSVMQPGQRIAVIGGGSVGLAVAAAARHLGADVDLEARYSHQQDAADALGARIGVTDRYDLVVDAVGSQSAFDRSVQACRNGGVVVELGVFWTPVSMSRDVVLREVTIAPAVFYAHTHDEEDFTTAVDVLARRPDIERVMVTHRFGLDEAEEAFRVAGDRSSGAIKVHFVV
ncbi:MAG: zinc-dependent alcohol dehydrogenase [Ilumatobacteraceae bacterium]